MRKRLTAILLSLCLVIALLPAVSLTAQAAAPQMSDYSATRISHERATIQFTSDQYGKFYYLVAEPDNPRPVEIGGIAYECRKGRNTFTIPNLTPGEKEIFIVLENDAGEKSYIEWRGIPALSLAAPKNPRWDPVLPGRVHWDPVEGVEEYLVTLHQDGYNDIKRKTKNTFYDFEMTTVEIYDGTYTFTVQSVSKDEAYANGVSIQSPSRTFVSIYVHNTYIMSRVSAPLNSLLHPNCILTGYNVHTLYRDAEHTQPWNFATDRVTEGEIHVYVEEKEPIVYQLTYETNGGTLCGEYSTQYTIEDRTVDLPENVTREGYVFAGWYDDWNFESGEITNANFGRQSYYRDLTLYARWAPVRSTILRASVNGVPGTIQDREITVVLPAGTQALPTDPEQVNIEMADGAEMSALKVSEDGTQWTFTVTNADGAQVDYTIHVSIEQSEAQQAVAAAKAAIEHADWTVPQATANTADAVKTWVETRLAELDLGEVQAVVTMTEDSFTAAVAGTDGNEAGTNGSFGFTVALSQGEAIDTASVTGGVITATAYAPQPDPEMPFTDVDPEAWYYENVAYVYENGLIVGTSETQFSPNVSLSRVMVWAILSRIDGADTGEGSWKDRAWTWATTTGISDGTDPDRAVTREEFAAMLYRYAKSKDYDMSAGQDVDLNTYTDAAQISNYAVESMQWAVGEKILYGRTSTTLVPKGTATRAEAAAFFQRFCENVLQ